MRRIRDHVVLATGAAVFCGPVLMLFVAATHGDGLGGRAAPSLLPGSGLATNFERLTAILEDRAQLPGFRAMLATSGILGLGTAAIGTAVSFLAAYTMVFCARPWVRIWFWITLATLYFPIEARMLATFDVANDLGLINSRVGMMLPILPLAVGTLVFRQHLRALPPAYLEAARLDGAGPLRFLRDFAVPLSLAPLGAVFLIAFIWGWNQYLWPLMIGVDGTSQTLMHGLAMLGAGSGAGVTLAALSMIPPLVLAIGFQRLLHQLGRARP